VGKIFNILTSSIGLISHFAANPIAHPHGRLIHRIILASLAKVPRQVQLSKLRHVEGHCFAVDLDDDLIDDSFSSSSILLFENGQALPRPHVRDQKKIASVGLGMAFHAQRTIYFATSDNTSPLTNGRTYVAVHHLTVNPARFKQSFDLQKTTKKVGAARFLEILSILCPSHFGFGRISGDGPDTELMDLHCAIDQSAQLRLAAQSMSVRAVSGQSNEWEFDIRNLRSVELPELRWQVRGRLNIGLRVHAILPYLELSGPDGFSAALEYGHDKKFSLRAGNLRPIRDMMHAWFRNEAEFDQWVSSLCRLMAAPLHDGGFGLPEGHMTLRDVMLDTGVDGQYEFTVEQADSGRVAKLSRIDQRQ
jgi:hypothetical protein